MFKFDRVRTAVKNYLAEDNKDFSITFNLAQFLDATLEDSAHAIITRLPSKIATRQNYRALSLFASHALIDGGLLILVGSEKMLPTSWDISELKFETSVRIAKTEEFAFVFSKKSQFGSLSRFRLNPFAFKNYESLVNNYTIRGETVIDPFKSELKIGQIVLDSGCAFISADVSASSNRDFVKSIEVSPCSK